MNNCAEYEELLSAYIDDELEGPDRRHVENHLAVCESCRALLNIYREISLAAKESLEPAPEALRDSVMEKIRSGNTDIAADRMKKLKLVNLITTRIVPIAACLAITLITLPRLANMGCTSSELDYPDARQVSAPLSAPVAPGGAADAPAEARNEPAAESGASGAWMEMEGMEDDDSVFVGGGGYSSAADMGPNDQPVSDVIPESAPEPNDTASGAPEPAPAPETDIGSGGTQETEQLITEETFAEDFNNDANEANNANAANAAIADADAPDQQTVPEGLTAEGGQAPNRSAADEYYAVIMITGELPDILAEFEASMAAIDDYIYYVVIPREKAMQLTEADSISIEYGNEEAETAMVYFSTG